MLHAGLRRIEVANLKWSDVALDRNLIILRTTKGDKRRGRLKAAEKEIVK
jgi:integrase